ncbi:uncharacterized protein LOC110025096 [Phalaenopsis equestris]|uniref:uncharacterized protein LOC110025096 n=1 Tax=Phalaenopsis equestris TaxID=78828 RepID=UPI0009E553E6|nr:uncharacterized protein LOC110025096 [Phalaenopsis equestris]
MKLFSRAILNCSSGRGGGAGGGAGDDVFPNPKGRTPDHPPYAEMVSVALRALAEENGSAESSISSYIKSNFNDLPWGHDRLLPYYLSKLVVDGELMSPCPDRYQLSLDPPPSVSLPIRRRGRGRPRLHPLNPNPRFSRPSSALPSHRGSSQPLRRRGRPRKILVEDAPPLHPEEGTRPLRRGRGRSRIQRGTSKDHTASQRLGLRTPKSNGFKRRQDSFLVNNNEELNCQSGNSASFDNIKNGDSDCIVLEDPVHVKLGLGMLVQGQLIVPPELSDAVKEQYLGEEPPLSILEQGAMPSSLVPEHFEHAEEQPLQGNEQPFVAPEQTEVNQDQSFLGEKLPLLNQEQGILLSFAAPEFFEHDRGQLMQVEALPFMPPEQTELVQVQSTLGERQNFFTTESGKVQSSGASELFEQCHDQGEVLPLVAPEQMEQMELNQDHSSPKERPSFFIPEPGKVVPFLAPEFFERDQGQPCLGEAPSFMPLEQTELVQKQSIEGPPLLTPERHEHDHGLPSAASDESEDGYDQSFLEIGADDPKVGELALMPHPHEEELENPAVSNKKRKSHGNRRRHRLWFES